MFMALFGHSAMSGSGSLTGGEGTFLDRRPIDSRKSNNVQKISKICIRCFVGPRNFNRMHFACCGDSRWTTRTDFNG